MTVALYDSMCKKETIDARLLTRPTTPKDNSPMHSSWAIHRQLMTGPGLPWLCQEVSMHYLSLQINKRLGQTTSMVYINRGSFGARACVPS